MRLADDDLTIRLDGDTLFLRPTLRTAMRLERRYGLPELRRGVLEGSVTVVQDIIREAASRPTFELVIPPHGLAGYMAALTLPLLAFLVQLYGLDEEHRPQATDEKPITVADALEHLFRRATGWLRWSPETAWNATPREIMTAFDGLLESRGGNQDGPSLDEKVGAMMRKLDADDRAEAREKDRERRKLKLRLKAHMAPEPA